MTPELIAFCLPFCRRQECSAEKTENELNPIPTIHGRNQPIYECHVTKAGRNRVKLWDRFTCHHPLITQLSLQYATSNFEKINPE